jgi:predicted amidophosphoribosyltransferase
VVLDYKGGEQEYRFGLAELLAGQAANSYIAAMPSTEAKIKNRGFDTVTVLAKSLRNEKRNVKLLKNAIAFRREVSDQIGLSAKERTTNLAGALVAQRQVPSSLILLDDVVTTGASMINAAQALHLAGAKNISGLALCTTPGFGLRYPYGSHPGP